MRELIVLGATGSIGLQTFDVVRNNNLKVRAIAFGSNIKTAIKIIEEFEIECVCINDASKKKELETLFPNIKVLLGIDGIKYILKNFQGDVVNAITGIDGLIPTMEALENKKCVYLANKESLVVAGKIINEKYKDKIFPLDSEHNAIIQLLKGIRKEDLKKIIITASGGAFRDYNRSQLENVKIEDALNHPNWSMGKKITIDSATMVNKGLEVIEAFYLFDLEIEKIETVIHRESIIHSFVTLNDNSTKALLYNPTMVIPIQNCLLNSNQETKVSEIDFQEITKLTFEKMDYNRFPLLKLAYDVIKLGGLYPTIYNASNEIAVSLFLENKISFLEIENIITKSVLNFKNDKTDYTIDDIISLDQLIKNNIRGVYE